MKLAKDLVFIGLLIFCYNMECTFSILYGYIC